MTKKRLRDLGINIGRMAPGKFNAITDVDGVVVGHSTVRSRAEDINTGVTVVIPYEGITSGRHASAGFFRFNGAGDMTGIQWIEETGTLISPIALTGTHQLGVVRDTIAKETRIRKELETYANVVVGETWDGWLSDPMAPPLSNEQISQAITSATTGPVEEGNVGGGTGMMSFDFKAGIGTSSRVVETACGTYKVGVLVQANFGYRKNLIVNGVPLGEKITHNIVPSPWGTPQSSGSIIGIIATDAPMLPSQCKRLAKRASLGIAKTGGFGEEGSGDLFIAFSSGNQYNLDSESPIRLSMFPPEQLDPIFEGVVDATTESILNALCAAEDMSGYKGRKAYAIPQKYLLSLPKE